MLKFRVITVLFIVILTLFILFGKGFAGHLFILGTILTYIIILAVGVSSIRLKMFLDPINSNPSKKNEVALTFDDGPSEKTPKILEILNEYEAKATFFLIGKKITTNYNLVRKLADQGHTIGNHSFGHKNTFPIMNVDAMCRELSKTNEELNKILGQRTSYFRPPFGVSNPNVAKAVKRLDLTVIGWNIRSFDTMRNRQKKVILRSITKRIKGGDIILMHDTSEHVLWLTEQLLVYLNEKNLKAVTIKQLIS